jgi:3-oxoadipate enol-lactonase
VQGITLAVEERGEGFPFLLVQGLGCSRWPSSPQWDDYALRRRVLAFDNRGTGLSPTPPGPYTVEQLADDAAGVLDERGIEHADIYGHSLGGYIALTLAVRRPELVRSLVLVGTGPGGADHVPVPEETLEVWLGAAGMPAEQAARQSLATTFPPGWPEEHPEEYERWVTMRLDPPTPRECWWAQLQAGGAYAQRGVAVETIASPALVIHGDGDRVVPLENGQVLARRMPSAELVVLEGRCHMPMLETPEEFGAAVCGFLDRF